MLATAVSRRTLIVEDHAASCEVLARTLKRLGHEARPAGTIYVALRELRTFKPTHVLLDLMLPDGDGAEIIRVIREEELPIRVALMTAAAPGSRVWEEAIYYRPDAIFRKPWDLGAIRAWLAETSEHDPK